MMVKFSKALTTVVLALFLVSGSLTFAVAAEKQAFETLEQRVSYAIGLNLGQDFKKRGIEIDPELLRQGVADAVSGSQPQMSQKQLQTTLQEFQQKMQKQEQQRRQKQGKANQEKGQAFMEKYKQKDGVKSLANGVMYRVVQEGSGPKPSVDDKVKVHYKGKLVDGSVFDSSYKRNKPAVFTLNKVIPGWQEALKNMPVGSKWEVVIPPEQAYGERGAGKMIGPNETLIFEVELLNINPEEAQQEEG